MNLWWVTGVVCLIGAEALIYGYSDRFFPLALEKRELAIWLIGLNASLAGAGIILVGPFLPWLVSKFEIRRLVASLFAISVLSFATILVVDYYIVWFIACFIMGGGLASLWTVSNIWLNIIADTKSRQRSERALSPAVPNLTYLEDSSFEEDEPTIPPEILAEAQARPRSFPASGAGNFRPRHAAASPPSPPEPTDDNHRYESDLTETFRQRAAKIAEKSAEHK